MHGTDPEIFEIGPVFGNRYVLVEGIDVFSFIVFDFTGAQVTIRGYDEIPVFIGLVVNVAHDALVGLGKSRELLIGHCRMGRSEDVVGFSEFDDSMDSCNPMKKWIIRSAFRLSSVIWMFSIRGRNSSRIGNS